MQNNIWRRAAASFFLLLQSVWTERGRPLRWSLPSSGASSIQTSNRPPAGRLTVAKRIIKVALSRRGVKESGVTVAEVRATMPRFDCPPEIRLIWTDAHGVKSKQPRKCICPPRSHRHTLAARFGSEWSRYFASVLTKPSWTIVSPSGLNFCNISVFISHDNHVPGSDNNSRHGVDLQCTNICSIMAAAWEKKIKINSWLSRSGAVCCNSDCQRLFNSLGRNLNLNGIEPPVGICSFWLPASVYLTSGICKR